MKYKLQIGISDYLEVTDKGFKLSNEATLLELHEVSYWVQNILNKYKDDINMSICIIPVNN